MAASNTSPSEPSPELRNNATQTIQRSFSCVLCAQRKVKCDRRPDGCANCAKALVPCIYKAPPPARRRKKGERDVDTTARIRFYEDALRQLGVDPIEVVRQGAARESGSKNTAGANGVNGLNDFLKRGGPEMDAKTNPPSEVGVLVTEDGKSRYLENGIWTSLQSEFRDSKDILDEESDEDYIEKHESVLSEHSTLKSTNLLFGGQRSSIALRSLHPEPVQIFKLWQLYLDNINPLVKVFHAPTIQQLILDASGDLDCVSRNVEALMFAIYCISVESLADGECISILGQSKASALRQFRSAAQCALTNASLLKSSDIIILQAFTLFILSLQSFDARVIWIWSGVAQRIGQRIGLHREAAKLGLPPFEVEMRRRLWWQIMLLEGFSQKLAGVGTNGTVLMGDVSMPSNVNDSDLFPGMKDTPKEHEGATEMMFFLIKCHAAEFLKRSADTYTTFDGVWNHLTTNAVPVAIKDQAISELELLIQRKFSQYCDSSIPWHLMCSQLGKAIIFMMRFMAHSAGYHSVGTAQSEKDKLFALALQVTSFQNQAYTMKEMQGFIWHVNLHFQWKAFLFILSELRYRTEGAEVTQAWKEVEKTYEFHPSFDKELARRALPIAFGRLTLKAWDAYIAAQGLPSTGEPYYIQIIRYRQYSTRLPNELSNVEAIPQKAAQISQSTEGLVDESSSLDTNMLQLTDWNTADLSLKSQLTSATFETVVPDYPENLDWAAWNNLFIDFQMDNTDDMSLDLSTFNFAMQ